MNPLSKKPCSAWNDRETDPTSDHGSILVLTLVVMTLMSALALAAANYVSAGLQLARVLNDDLHAGLAARAGVAFALAEVDALPEDRQWDGFAEDPARFEHIAVGTRGEVSIHGGPADEIPRPGIAGQAARVNLNRADRNLVAALFQVAASADRDRALEWADRMIERRYANAQAIRELTNRNGNGYHEDASDSPEMAWRSWHEVFLSVDEELREALVLGMPHATLLGGDPQGKVNLNVAGTVVLTAIGVAVRNDPVTARQLAEKIVALRETGYVFEPRSTRALVGEIEQKSGFLNAEQRSLLMAMIQRYGTLRSQGFGGTAVGRVKPAGSTDRGTRTPASGSPMTRRIDFVVQRDPLKVLYWHEY